MPELVADADTVTIPKVELHVHLNGSITVATAFTPRSTTVKAEVLDQIDAWAAAG